MNRLVVGLSSIEEPLAELWIDGKELLRTFNLRKRFKPLGFDEFEESLRAMEHLSLSSETIKLEGFNVAVCICGQSGCDALFCDISLVYGEFVWTNFQSNGGVRLKEIGPYCFDFYATIKNLGNISV